MALDIFQYLNQLELERYRAFILHAALEKSKAVNQFAKKIHERVGGQYLDLLDLFLQTKEYSEKIDQFGLQELRSLLIEKSKGQALIIIDRVDFLLDTWLPQDRQSFFWLINNQWDGFKDDMKASLMICLQTSQDLENQLITDSQSQSRVLKLSDFNDIV